uniref:Uncharacterized protein n=1 Tax=Macaca nemestrina TaxID=9545 RepID=A0A2K6DNF6_MACNE
MVSHSELRKLFYSADAACFDVDSTVIREEGISELAKICGVEDAVSEIPGAVKRVNLEDSGPGCTDCWVSLLGHGQPWAGSAFQSCFYGSLSPHPALQGAGAETHSRAPSTPDPWHKVSGAPAPGVFQHQCWGAPPPESI